jgi:DNA-binding MarR family transcriptional regulator
MRAAMAIFPPLTANETAVLEALSSDPADEFTVEGIAERADLDREQAERALRSLESRQPPLTKVDYDDRGRRTWRPANALAALLA